MVKWNHVTEFDDGVDLVTCVFVAYGLLVRYVTETLDTSASPSTKKRQTLPPDAKPG